MFSVIKAGQNGRPLHWGSLTPMIRMPTVSERRCGAVLFFARVDKKINGESAPFIYLGPAQELITHEGNRPIRMVWELKYPVPAALFEEAR
jgi:hypothetical protein